MKKNEFVKFNGVKVFSASMWQDRDGLGEKASEWIRERQSSTWKLVDINVSQSSDASFHMVALTVFYQDDAPASPVSPPTRRLVTT